MLVINSSLLVSAFSFVSLLPLPSSLCTLVYISLSRVHSPTLPSSFPFQFFPLLQSSIYLFFCLYLFCPSSFYFHYVFPSSSFSSYISPPCLHSLTLLSFLPFLFFSLPQICIFVSYFLYLFSPSSFYFLSCSSFCQLFFLTSLLSLILHFALSFSPFLCTPSLLSLSVSAIPGGVTRCVATPLLPEPAIQVYKGKGVVGGSFDWSDFRNEVFRIFTFSTSKEAN